MQNKSKNNIVGQLDSAYLSLFQMNFGLGLIVIKNGNSIGKKNKK